MQLSAFLEIAGREGEDLTEHAMSKTACRNSEAPYRVGCAGRPRITYMHDWRF